MSAIICVICILHTIYFIMSRILPFLPCSSSFSSLPLTQLGSAPVATILLYVVYYKNWISTTISSNALLKYVIWSIVIAFQIARGVEQVCKNHEAEQILVHSTLL